ncbi:MAG TPA: hypothetical protein VIV60_20920 [Polyangiaceae bacterium]
MGAILYHRHTQVPPLCQVVTHVGYRMSDHNLFGVAGLDGVASGEQCFA